MSSFFFYFFFFYLLGVCCFFFRSNPKSLRHLFNLLILGVFTHSSEFRYLFTFQSFFKCFPVRYKCGSSPAHMMPSRDWISNLIFLSGGKKRSSSSNSFEFERLRLTRKWNVSMFDQKSGDEITVGQSYFFFPEWELIISWLFMHQQIGDHVSILLATEPQWEKSFCSYFMQSARVQQQDLKSRIREY